MPVEIDVVDTQIEGNDQPQAGATPPPRAGHRLQQPPRPAPPSASPFFGVYPALVVDVRDPQQGGRVEISLPWAIDPDGDDYRAWARVATLMAGPDSGTWFIPEVDDEVLVAFEAGNPRRPYVVGALWNGADQPPATMDSSGKNEVKLIKSKNGIEIRIEDHNGKGKIELKTPAGHTITMDDDARNIMITDVSGNEVELSNAGVRVETTGAVELIASQARVSAGSVQVDAGMSRFSGVVQCDTLITNTVVAATYTPGAGNIW